MFTDIRYIKTDDAQTTGFYGMWVYAYADSYRSTQIGPLETREDVENVLTMKNAVFGLIEMRVGSGRVLQSGDVVIS